MKGLLRAPQFRVEVVVAATRDQNPRIANRMKGLLLYFRFFLVISGPFHVWSFSFVAHRNLVKRFSNTDTGINQSFLWNRHGKKTFLHDRTQPFLNTVVFAALAEPIAIRNNISESESVQANIRNKLEVVLYLILWYFLSAVYNIYNKKALNCLALPWFVATVQMGTGLLLLIPLWIFKLRELPASNISDFFEVAGFMKSVALYQTLTHISGVIALGSGVVSFTQVVKASEPVFTAGISAIFLREYLPWQVYMSLVPVCVGVAIASTKELSFSWYCLTAGILANVFGAARGVFGKTQMCGETSCLEQLSPPNYYAVLTILSFLMLIPVTTLLEGNQILSIFRSAVHHIQLFMSSHGICPSSIVKHSLSESLSSQKQFEGLLYSLGSGVLFYLYNEVSFRTLNKVHPVTHAVSNTVKRIVIILSSVMVFNNKMTPTVIFGTCLAISGVFMYSICQYLYKPKK